jgi:hypothetical protein
LIVQGSDYGIAKHAIALSWGATLYTSDPIVILPSDEPTADLNLSRLTREQAWGRYSSTLMCSMVLTLDAIKILGEAFSAHYHSWSREQLIEILVAMQCCFDHARCFNANSLLRTELKAKNFMRFRDSPQRPPHLREQLTQACAQIMTSCFRLFKEEEREGEGSMKADLAEPIIKRFDLTSLSLDAHSSLVPRLICPSLGLLVR